MLFSFVYFFCLPRSLSVPFCCNFLSARHIFRGKAWAEGKGALATYRHCADSGQETDST